MKLKAEIIEQIKEDKTLFVDIQKALNTTEGTMYRHLRKNTPRLIGMDVLNIISLRTGLQSDQLTVA